MWIVCPTCKTLKREHKSYQNALFYLSGTVVEAGGLGLFKQPQIPCSHWADHELLCVPKTVSVRPTVWPLTFTELGQVNRSKHSSKSATEQQEQTQSKCCRVSDQMKITAWLVVWISSKLMWETKLDRNFNLLLLNVV